MSGELEHDLVIFNDPDHTWVYVERVFGNLRPPPYWLTEGEIEALAVAVHGPEQLLMQRSHLLRDVRLDLIVQAETR